MQRLIREGVYAVAGMVLASCLVASGPSAGAAQGERTVFPRGAATPAEACGACHVAIYGEYAYGFGTDLRYRGAAYRNVAAIKLAGSQTRAVAVPTAHALAGSDPAFGRKGGEAGLKTCGNCHFPRQLELPPLDAGVAPLPEARPIADRAGGVTCASCHLTPDGKIRTPHAVVSPHETVLEPALATSTACASCHARGRPRPGKQAQTFFEWRDDYLRAGLGTRQCQDCHMPRTRRKAAEAFPVPERPVARHIWSGGHSGKRVAGGLDLAVSQVEPGKPRLAFRVSNVGAAHSVPTGTHHRAMYLRAQLYEKTGRVVADRLWMFAPQYGDRPDDKSFLPVDKSLPDGVAAARADAQGPHAGPLKAGEERTLYWTPPYIRKGSYTLRVSLSYDLDRYSQSDIAEDQIEFQNIVQPLLVREIPVESCAG